MKKASILIIVLMMVTVGLLSGCVTQIPEGKISLVVDYVEKRHYDDYAQPASTDSIFVYTFFTIKNEAVEELSTSSFFFNLKSLTGKTYSPKWLFGTGGSEAAAISKGASASYYIAFEVDEDEDITTSWQLNFSSFQATKSANLTNIKSGFRDVFLATLTIDDYYYSDVGDYDWDTPSEGNTFLYVFVTLSNSADNDKNINTNQYFFMLYTTDGGYYPEWSDTSIPDEIIPAGEASWYMYFEIPEDVTLDKLEYNPWDIVPVEASFS